MAWETTKSPSASIVGNKKFSEGNPHENRQAVIRSIGF
jgi:hypothetical protein